TLIVNDAGGADAPQRRHAGIVLTGREFAALVFGDVALATRGAIGGNARGVAEVVERLEPVRARDAAVGVLQLRVALRDQLIDALVINDPFGGQNVVVVVDLDVALGNDTARLAVVDKLISLQVEGLGAIDLGGWAEDAARLARKGLR